MMRPGLLKNLEETVQFIRSRSNVKPRVGMILGSGLGAFVNQVDVDVAITYDEIPSFINPTVEGHQGRLILGHVGTIPVAVLQGRVHYYEGHSMDVVVYPTRTLAMLGIEVLVLTNSAGGLNPIMTPGDFMILTDHINLMGDNPLKGPNLKQLGPRFPDMTEAYDRRLVTQLEKSLAQNNVRHSKGVYCAVSGPTYETPAEVNYLKIIGGQAVGMSTVPESIAANHLGLRVCALSCITNLGAGLSSHKLSHDDVTQTAKMVEQQFSKVMKEFLTGLEASIFAGGEK
jgi:purine-nucleoside phosphorylase